MTTDCSLDCIVRQTSCTLTIIDILLTNFYDINLAYYVRFMHFKSNLKIHLAHTT